jgi:hypothetical protein
MALKTCEKCGESVDEAKAFCPACGNAFVSEEKRESTSEFDRYAGTVNVSQSVYKMMLSDFDMQTSKSEAALAPEPIFKPTPPPVQVVSPEIVAPIEESKSGNALLIVLICVIVLLIMVMAAVLAALLYLYF